MKNRTPSVIHNNNRYSLLANFELLYVDILGDYSQFMLYCNIMYISTYIKVCALVFLLKDFYKLYIKL